MNKKTFNRLIIIISLIGALIGAGLYFSSVAPGANAAGNNFTLIWSANSYTPPEYKGKALPTQGSRIKVVASPLKSGVNPERMTYLWLLDNEEQGTANGRGKDYFTFAVEKPASARYQIIVKIMDENENLIERLSLSIKIQNPEILILNGEKNYLPRILSAKTGEELRLVGAPLFFNVKSPAELDFSWEENNRIFSSALQTNPQEINIKISGEKTSKKTTKTIFAKVSKKTDDFERTRREINLEINP